MARWDVLRVSWSLVFVVVLLAFPGRGAGPDVPLMMQQGRALQLQGRKLRQQGSAPVDAPVAQSAFGQEQCLMQFIYKATVTVGNSEFYLSSFAFGDVEEGENVTAWRLGVTFADGNGVRDQGDVLSGGQVMLQRNGTQAVFNSSSPYFYVNSDTSPVSFAFVESLGPNATVPTPVTDVVFNNLKCKLGRTLGDLERVTFDEKMTPVELEYVPLQVRNGSNSDTLFSFRVRNNQEQTSIGLENLKIMYYFHGIDDPPDPIFENPEEFFGAKCTPLPGLDCNGVVVEVVSGYRNISDAQFAVRVTFEPNSGSLLATQLGETFNPGAQEAAFSQRGLFISVFGANGTGLVLDEREDYSFEETPLGESDPSSEFVLRTYAPNERMTVYYDDLLIWGVSPGPVADPDLYTYTCQNGTSQQCQFTAEYCCEPIDPCQEEITRTPGAGWTYDGVLRLSEDGELAASAAERCPEITGVGGDVSLSPESENTTNTGSGNSTAIDSQALFPTASENIAWIIGLVCGLALAAIALIAVIWFLRRRRRNSQVKGMVETDSDVSPKEDWEPPDARELSWYIPIHARLENNTLYKHVRDTSDLTTEPSGASPVSSQVSSLQVSNGEIPFEARAAGLGALYTQRSLGAVSTGRGVDRAGSLSPRSLTSPMSPKSPKSPKYVRIVPGYGGVAPLPPNADLLIYSKCPTMSGRFSPYVSRALEEKRSIECEDLDDDDEMDDEGDGSSFDVIEDWQLTRRAKSWDGCLTVPDMDMDSQNAARKIKKRRESHLHHKPGPMLPPVSQLDIPMMGHDIQPSIDLHIPASTIEKSLTKCIGSGGFGSVYLGKFKGMDVAVKKLPPFVQLRSGNSEGKSAYDALIREISLASKFASDRLVKVYGACTDDRNKCCLIMELMKGGNLYQRIHDKKRRRMTYIEILQVAHDIAEGLAYLHPIVIHRDLKPQNILLDEEGRAKIADFGISKVKDPHKSYLTKMTAENGTPMYMSPEQMNGSKVDEKVDTYALGCIMNEMWTRRQPWKESNHFFQIILKVAVNGDRPWMDPETPSGLARLIKKCWHQDPHQRPSCADVLRRLDILIRDELDRWDRQVSRKSSLTSAGGSLGVGSSIGNRTPESVKSMELPK